MIDYKAKAMELYPVKEERRAANGELVQFDNRKKDREKFIEACQWLLSELSNPKEDEELLGPHLFGDLITRKDILQAMAEVRQRERAMCEMDISRKDAELEKCATTKRLRAISYHKMKDRYLSLQQQLAEKDKECEDKLKASKGIRKFLYEHMLILRRKLTFEQRLSEMLKETEAENQRLKAEVEKLKEKNYKLADIIGDNHPSPPDSQ